MRKLAFVMAWAVPAAAQAGGIFVGETGPQAQERGGAFVAKADDPTALLLNPAGLMKARSGELFLGSNLAVYSLKYRRSGTYENQPDRTTQPPYVGQAFDEMSGASGPQPLPALAVTYHLPGLPLAVGAGVFAPNAFPGRDFKCNVDENCVTTANGAPAPQRYDIISQEAVIILPSLGVAWRILPELDVGVRVAWGFGKIRARSFTWGIRNLEEDPTKDGDFLVDVSDGFIPQIQLGVLFRPTEFLEIGAQWTSGLSLEGKGTGEARLGANVSPFGQAMLVPVDDVVAVCDKGGTASQLKACVTTKIPQFATLGARYVFRDGAGAEKADVELDLRWENWRSLPDPGGERHGPSHGRPGVRLRHGAAVMDARRHGREGAVHPDAGRRLRAVVAARRCRRRVRDRARADRDGRRHHRGQPRAARSGAAGVPVQFPDVLPHERRDVQLELLPRIARGHGEVLTSARGPCGRDTACAPASTRSLLISENTQVLAGMEDAKPPREKEVSMFGAALAFLLIAIVAGVLGFGGIAATAAGFAKVVFVVALVLAVVGFVLGRRSA
jgi:uncharacterized membrane protein YtjA (UPF0391 family)